MYIENTVKHVGALLTQCASSMGHIGWCQRPLETPSHPLHRGQSPHQTRSQLSLSLLQLVYLTPSLLLSLSLSIFRYISLPLSLLLFLSLTLALCLFFSISLHLPLLYLYLTCRCTSLGKYIHSVQNPQHFRTPGVPINTHTIPGRIG